MLYAAITFFKVITIQQNVVRKGLEDRLDSESKQPAWMLRPWWTSAIPLNHDKCCFQGWRPQLQRNWHLRVENHSQCLVRTSKSIFLIFVRVSDFTVTLLQQIIRTNEDGIPSRSFWKRQDYWPSAGDCLWPVPDYFVCLGQSPVLCLRADGEEAVVG